MQVRNFFFSNLRKTGMHIQVACQELSDVIQKMIVTCCNPLNEGRGIAWNSRRSIACNSLKDLSQGSLAGPFPTLQQNPKHS